jgi:Tfp pilus assembly protein PilO
MPVSGENAMKQLSKEKRNQLILVVLLTCVALGGLWFGLISYQQENLIRMAEKKEAADRKLKQVKSSIASAEAVEEELKAAARQVATLEEGMAYGDLYSWAINTIRQFKLGHKVEIPQYSQIDGPKDMNLLAGFPYQQATLTIGGTAYFQDLGRFIADFENRYPHIRLCNLTVEPLAAVTPGDREKLLFRVDVVFLVRPNA